MDEGVVELTGEALKEANRRAAANYLEWVDGLSRQPQERILEIIDRYHGVPRGCHERTIRLLCRGIHVTRVLRHLRELGYVQYRVVGRSGSSRKDIYWRLT